MNKKKTIYTIGHSTHQLSYFLELLKEYNINCIVDVRSVPASAYNPQFNQEPFKRFLKNHKIAYLHFGKEFGARQTDPNLFDNEGILDFKKVRKTNSFKSGLERIMKGDNKGFNLAIMCSESDPLDCHRFSMISVGLIDYGFNINHIMKDKTIKTQSELEKDLLKQFNKKLPQRDLFNPNIGIKEQLVVAYKLKNKKIGYSLNSINKNEGEYYD